jgi:hypothetical protein
VFVENVQQEPTTAYTIAGTTLSFTAAPVTGSNNIYVIHRGPAVQKVTPPTTFGVGSIYGASDTDTAITFEGSGVTTFDQNGSEAARIDASGNLLVGTTNTNPAFSNVAGTVIRNDGLIIASRTNNALDINRKDSDGAIVNLRKDGTTVGSIGVVNNNNPFIANDADNSGLQFGTNQIIPHYDSLQRDNAVDLGSSSVRFKDLYLSGGVYLGGTGAANKLDDYEEGTWTPVVNTASGFTAGITSWWGNQPTYTKVGNTVFLRAGFYFQNSGGNVSTSDYVRIDSGLPYTPASQVIASGAYYAFNTSNNAHATCYMDAGGRPVIQIHTVYGAPNRSGGAFGMTLAYYTNS